MAMAAPLTDVSDGLDYKTHALYISLYDSFSKRSSVVAGSGWQQRKAVAVLVTVELSVSELRNFNK